MSMYENDKVKQY